MIRTALLLVSATLALAACGTKPPTAAFNRTSAESLLDVSAEVVNLSVADAKSVADLAEWIERDVPTRAELYCTGSEPSCKDAKKAFELMGVPVTVMGGGTQMATLVYERILARDCNPSFVDNKPNYYNAPTPSFGCAVSANMIQHVSDKQEFVNPALSDKPNATGAVSAYNRAYVARAAKNPDGYDLGDSLVSKAKSQ
jgi:hypothetical protein